MFSWVLFRHKLLTPKLILQNQFHLTQLCKPHSSTLSNEASSNTYQWLAMIYDMCVANAERKPCMSLCNYSSSRMTENFDHSLLTGDPKETYYIGPIEDTSIAHLNQWPSEGMAFLCIHFIRNRCCILICGWFVFTQAWLEMFFWQGHFRITAKLETYNGILILETNVSFISLSMCFSIPCYQMCTISC